MFRGKAKIFVEGVADKRFLEEYLAYLYGIRPERNDVISCDGWTNVGRESCVNQMRRNTDDGGENLLVFDADLKPCERRADIEAMMKKNNLSCQLFLQEK